MISSSYLTMKDWDECDKNDASEQSEIHEKCHGKGGLRPWIWPGLLTDAHGWEQHLAMGVIPLSRHTLVTLACRIVPSPTAHCAGDSAHGRLEWPKAYRNAGWRASGRILSRWAPFQCGEPRANGERVLPGTERSQHPWCLGRASSTPNSLKFPLSVLCKLAVGSVRAPLWRL